MASPVKASTAKPGSSRPERSSKEEEGTKGGSWFSGLWGGKSKADKASPEPDARGGVVDKQPMPRPVKTKDYHSKKTGEWVEVVADSKQQQQQPPRDAGGGETEQVSISPLDAALKYNEILNRKNDKLVKKLSNLDASVKAKDLEIARLKKSLQSTAAESGHLSQASDVSPSSGHRGIKQTMDHKAQLSDVQKENKMLRGLVADLEIRVKISDASSSNPGAMAGRDEEMYQLKSENAHLKEIAGRYEQMQEHSRGQSKEVMELKAKLQASEITQDDLTESLQKMVDRFEEENWQLRERLKTLNANMEGLTKENQQLQHEFQQLQTSTSRLGSLSSENTDLRAKVDELENERDTALSELETEKLQALTFKSDWEEERQDRERAHSIIGELESRLSQQSSHTATIALELQNLEVVKADYQKRLRENMATARTEIKRLRDDLSGKNSQVKQYVKQNGELKEQLEQAMKSIAKLSEEMDKLRKKVKKLPKHDKKSKSDLSNVEPDLSTEVGSLHTENEALLGEIAVMRALNKSLKEMLQETGRKQPTSSIETQTPVSSPQDHQSNMQKVPSMDQRPARSSQDEEIRQHLQQQFQQPSRLAHPIEEVPAAGTGKLIQSPQRASAPLLTSPDPPPLQQQQLPASAPNTSRQSQQAKNSHYYNLEVSNQRPQQQDLVNPKPAQQQSQQPEGGYENVGYSDGSVVQEEQVFGTAKPTNLPIREELYFGDPQGSGQERLQAYQASPRDQGYSYPKQGSGTPPVVSPGIITDNGNQPAPRAVQSDTQIPYEHHQQQQQQHEVQSPIPRPLPPGPSTTSQTSAQPFENKLQAGIDEDIAEVANDMGGGGDLVRQVTNVNAPYDPNLICPMCVKHFRIGEIQKYRKHVLECGGTGAAASSERMKPKVSSV